jgi:hypothetical protein
MNNLPLDGFMLLLSLAILLSLKGPRSFFKDLVTIGEDYWTWTTCEGEWYEDGEVEKIEAGELVLKHKFGVCRLAIDCLSESSRQLLFRTSQWRDHVSAGPTAGKVTAFVTHSQAAAQAA